MTRFYLTERKGGMKKGRGGRVNEFIRARAKEEGLVMIFFLHHENTQRLGSPYLVEFVGSP